MYKKFPIVRQIKKNPYFGSLFPGISRYFPFLQLPQKLIQIKITNYHFFLLSFTHNINIGSAAHVPHAHTFAVVCRLALHRTTLHRNIRCDVDLCVLKCVPSLKPALHTRVFTDILREYSNTKYLSSTFFSTLALLTSLEMLRMYLPLVFVCMYRIYSQHFRTCQ